jgi:hypothetical protein
MARRVARIGAGCALALYIGWEIALEPPGPVLLLGFVAALGLLVDFLIELPGDIRRLKAERHAPPRWWPRVPWGLDPISVLAGVAIGLATEWWIGVGVWALAAALLWYGWIKTRALPGRNDPLSPRANRLFNVVLYPALIGLTAVVIIQATSKWGEAGLLASVAGIGFWAFVTEELAASKTPEEFGGL